MRDLHTTGSIQVVYILGLIMQTVSSLFIADPVLLSLELPDGIVNPLLLAQGCTLSQNFWPGDHLAMERCPARVTHIIGQSRSA